MSTDTPTETQAQPGAGQGDALFQQYLSDVPAELHAVVEPKLREMSGHFDARFRELAEDRKRWEPYEQIEGFDKADPQTIEALLQFQQVAQDPDQFTQWLQAAAEQVGWDKVIDEDTWSSLGEANGWLDDDGDEDPNQDLLAQVQAMLDERLQPVTQQLTQQQQQQTIEQTQQELQGMLDAVKEQAGEAWTPELEAEVKNLAQLYVEEDDPFAKAYEHVQRLQGTAQADLIDTKLTQRNGTALPGGATDTTPPQLHLGDRQLKDAAKARFAASP